ncbi:MAG: hypothetical protein JWQ09_5212 [Segetibacter sp.]|nr:hypothetical protein [Segetibacter sp.]
MNDFTATKKGPFKSFSLFTTLNETNRSADCLFTVEDANAVEGGKAGKKDLKYMLV